MKKLVFGLVFIVVIAVVYASAFILREGQQAIIVQFGRPVGDPITEAGLHFKTPFIQEVRRLEKRILSWDGYQNQIPTKDNKYIWVDTTARWEISEPLTFIETVENEIQAKARLDAVLDAATRDVVSNHRLVETVRNTNQILERFEDVQEQIEGEIEEMELKEVTGEVERVEVGREKLSQMIGDQARESLKGFGIKLVDVQLKRISYNESVQEKVYDRMISGQQRIAEKIRSIGKGEQAKIRGQMNRDLQQIESQAYEQARKIEGKAEAEAITIYARAISQDPSFYNFTRKVEAYKESLGEDTELILSTDSDFLDLLKNSP